MFKIISRHYSTLLASKEHSKGKGGGPTDCNSNCQKRAQVLPKCRLWRDHSRFRKVTVTITSNNVNQAILLTPLSHDKDHSIIVWILETRNIRTGKLHCILTYAMGCILRCGFSSIIENANSERVTSIRNKMPGPGHLQHFSTTQALFKQYWQNYKIRKFYQERVLLFTQHTCKVLVARDLFSAVCYPTDVFLSPGLGPEDLIWSITERYAITFKAADGTTEKYCTVVLVPH